MKFKTKRILWGLMDMFFISVAIITLFIIIYAVSNATLTIEHELAHQEINRYYGYKSEINFSKYFQTGFFTITGEVNNSDWEKMIVLHSENEIVGYTAGGFIFPISVIATALVIIAFFKLTDARYQKYQDF